MSLTGIKTKPTLRGTVAVAGPWQALFARSGYRVYPYQMGCGIRVTSTGTTLSTYGLGEFAQNDFALLCAQTSYGNGSLYIPQTSKITKVTSDPSAAADDTLTIAPAISVTKDDWLLNLSTDGAAAPLSAPDYDGSDVQIFADPAAVANAALKYLLTGRGGLFRGWVDDAYKVVDLLITDASGIPVLVMPSFELGSSIV